MDVPTVLALAILRVSLAWVLTVKGLWDRLLGSSGERFNIISSLANTDRPRLEGVLTSNSSDGSTTLRLSLSLGRIRRTWTVVLASPRVVAVTTVDVNVEFVTLVARLEFPSVSSPRVARTDDKPRKFVSPIMGFSRIDSRVPFSPTATRGRVPSVGANN